MSRSVWFLFLVFGLVASSVCPAATINFDDIDASSGDVPLDGLSPYHQMILKNFTAYTDVPGFEGFNNGIVSGENAAYAGGETPGPVVVPVVSQITSANPFDVISSFVGAGYYDKLHVTVEGYREGLLRHRRTVTVDTQGAQFVNFGFTNITSLQFFAEATEVTSDPFGCGAVNCTIFTLDDIEVELNNPPIVPEISPFGALGAGMLVIVAAARSKKQSSTL